MYNIAVMGDYDSIYGFAALGLKVCPVTDAEEGARVLKKLSEEDTAVVYITEAQATENQHDIAGYDTALLPANIPIPGPYVNTGIGMANVKRSVERAVGSDIIFKEG